MPGPHACPPERGAPRRVSVIIPARDEAENLRRTLPALLAQAGPGVELEVLVVDDGSRDDTAEVARSAGARVLPVEPAGVGNPAAARNRGAAAATGDPLVFLDADCVPAPGWLAALLAAHDRGAEVVGGSLDPAEGLSLTARCDYYCGWYHVHSCRPPGPVPNHPPGNLSVRRAVFERTSGFTESHPVAYAHEELGWQAEVRRAGGVLVFEPRAIVRHRNRPGLGNLLRRNYRWGYSALESKAATGAARWAWLYRRSALLIASSLPLALASTLYVVGCWVRAGRLEPVLLAPAVLAARLAYSAGLAVGGLRWLRRGPGLAPERRPRWA